MVLATMNISELMADSALPFRTNEVRRDLTSKSNIQANKRSRKDTQVRSKASTSTLAWIYFLNQSSYK